MSDRMILSEDQTVELLAFFVTAARCLLDEPADYGSMRLLDAAERLSAFAQDQASPEAKTLFAQIIAESPKIQGIINQREQFADSMDTLCGSIAQYLVDSSGVGQGAS